MKMNYSHLLPRFAITLICLCAGRLSAQSFNVDFGVYYGSPDSTFAVSGVEPRFNTGTWNSISSIGSFDLLNLSGGASSVSLTLETLFINGQTAPVTSGSPTQLESILNDNFYTSAGNTWTVTVTGLQNGEYDILVFAPRHFSVETGDYLVNGTAFNSISGNSDSLTKGLTYDYDYNFGHSMEVTNGTVSIMSSSTVGYRGLSGLQIQQVSISAVPEPSSYAAILCGLVLGSARVRRRGRSPGC